MKSKANLNAQNILNKKFKANVKGYDSNEVDDYLDLIINDYKNFSKLINERNEYIAELETLVSTQRNTMRELELAKASLEQRLGNIKPGQKVSLETVEYIKRINILEEKLYALGVDPRKLK